MPILILFWVINPDNIQAVFNRANLKLELKDYTNAITDYDKTIALYPYFMEAYYNRAKAKTGLKDYAGAKKDLETGKLMSDIFRSKNDNQLNSDSVLLSKLFYLSSDFNQSAASKNDTTAIGFQPMFYLATCDTGLKKTKFDALLMVVKMHNKQLCFTNSETSSNSNLLNQTSNNDNEYSNETEFAYLELTIQKTNSFLLSDAQTCYDKFIKTDTNNVIALFERAVNTCWQADLLKKTAEPYLIKENTNSESQKQIKYHYQNALKDLTKVIELQPKSSIAYYNRAYVKCLQQDFNGALLDYEKAIKIDADFSEAYYNQGLILYYLNYKQQACASFSKAGELGLSQSYSMMKRYCF